MLNNPDIRKTRSYVSHSELTKMKCDPERNMRNRANPSCLTTFRRAKLWSEAVQEPKVSLEAALSKDTEGPPSEPTTVQAPVTAVSPAIANPIAMEPKDAMRETAIQETNAKFAEYAGPSMYNVQRTLCQLPSLADPRKRIVDAKSRYLTFYKAYLRKWEQKLLGRPIRTQSGTLNAVILFRGCHYPTCSSFSTLCATGCKVHSKPLERSSATYRVEKESHRQCLDISGILVILIRYVE